MIIDTRYRDVPWEEVRDHVHDGDAALWDTRRGRPIKIEVPGRSEIHAPLCDGPFFDLVGYMNLHGGKCAVCPHVAEIGD